MPLSSNSVFGVRPMTEAINKLPATPSIIRELGIFKPKYHSTTFVRLGEKNRKLNLVPAVPRGTPGEPVEAEYNHIGNFDMLHLPKHDVVLADDVQNLAAWGSDNKPAAVADLVNEKLADMKADIEHTREHLMFGALQGKILNADGTELVDIYRRFGLNRHKAAFSAAAAANITVELEKLKSYGRSKRNGEHVSGWICLCSSELFEAIISHKSMVDIYLRYQEAKAYREGFDGHFETAGVEFVLYDEEFASKAKIKAKQGIILPKGAQNTFFEHFAPANMNSAANARARPYYASREKFGHEGGWDLKAQSNPLPLVHRPELVFDVAVA